MEGVDKGRRSGENGYELLELALLMLGGSFWQYLTLLHSLLYLELVAQQSLVVWWG